VCPRCAEPTTDEFYGPCAACRGELRRNVAGPRITIGEHSSRRIWRDIAPKATAWVVTGTGATATGDRTWTSDTSSLRTLFASAPVKVERFMLAELPVAFGAWCADLPEGWELVESYEDRNAPVMRFAAGDGRRLEVRSAVPWMGDGGWTARQAGQAWELVREVISRRFDGAEPLASPAATGQELWARGLGAGDEYHTLSAEVLEMMRPENTQARIELVEHQGDLPELVEYDGRFMYGALCAGLPHGAATIYNGEPTPYDRLRGGWYEARWMVPVDWNGLGILPVRGTGGWTWPTTQGVLFRGWVTAVELDQARTWGWQVDVLRSVLFDRHPGPGPLDKWSKRLQAARAEVSEDSSHDDPAVRDLAAGAMRAILVTTVGSFIGKERTITCSAGAGEPIPATALGIRHEGNRLVWEERRPAARPAMVHPEWAWTIWARCRARMLDGPGGRNRPRTGALHMPGEVVAIRTDALYLTRDPSWHDDGANGRLRHKMTIPGPIPAPANHGDLLTLRRGAGVS
jgi:hypothetical protein